MKPKEDDVQKNFNEWKTTCSYIGVNILVEIIESVHVELIPNSKHIRRFVALENTLGNGKMLLNMSLSLMKNVVKCSI